MIVQAAVYRQNTLEFDLNCLVFSSQIYVHISFSLLKIYFNALLPVNLTYNLSHLFSIYFCRIAFCSSHYLCPSVLPISNTTEFSCKKPTEAVEILTSKCHRIFVSKIRHRFTKNLVPTERSFGLISNSSQIYC